ncbi:MAG: endonuclease [Burkholderiales bacterium]|nr:endonuclease [Phycisphaerae bacterium]
MKYFRAVDVVFVGVIAAPCADLASADYQAPNPAYSIPAGYYSSATGTGATLKFSLNEIIDGHILRSYSGGAHDAAMRKLDEDPNNSNNVLLVYNGVSVAKSAVLNTTYNREHLWPNSYGLDDTNRAFSDLYNLRVCDAIVNSDRNNDYYDNGGNTAHPSAPDCRQVPEVSWEPRDVEKGELARAMFYMDTRYEGHANDDFARNLTLVGTGQLSTINTSNNNMGNLTTLLKWHYEHGVSNSERRRNHLIQTSDTSAAGWNGTANHQGNRNPFVDHPEYVWSIFGDGANDSKIYVGDAPPANGTSTVTVSLGRVLVGAPLSNSSFILKRAGADPTTYDIGVTGSATSAASGTGQTIGYSALARSIPVGLSGSTATAGQKSGTITIDNTELTNDGTGTGSLDGVDTITVTGDVLSHSKASLNPSTQLTSLTLDFGTRAQGTGFQTLPLGVSNLITTANFTAALDLDVVSSTGNSSTLAANIATLANIAAGTTQLYNATLSTATNGSYTTTYSITTSDENLPGAIAGSTLTLTLLGQVATRQWFVNSDSTWSSSNNWLGPVPAASGDAANFLDVITAPRTVTLDGPKSVGAVTFDSPFSYTVAGPSTLTLADANGASIAVVSGDHIVNAPVSLASHTAIAVAAGSRLTISDLKESVSGLTKTGAGTFELNVARVGALSIESGKVEITANGQAAAVSKISSLTIVPDGSGDYLGTLDLHDNDLIIEYGQSPSPYAQVVAMMHSGLFSKGGNGTGLTSTEVNLNTRAGATIAIVDGANGVGAEIQSLSGFSDFSHDSILVKYTWTGDCNLDGEVNGSDYALADTGFSGGGAGWYFGDINYDGTVTGSDFALIDTGFSSQSGPLPEPGIIGVLGLGIIGLLRRRSFSGANRSPAAYRW